MSNNTHHADTPIAILNGITGRAQPLYSTIFTPNGWVALGDINIDDEIIIPGGAVSRISAVYPQGKKHVYNITLWDGRATQCCDEQPWLVHIPAESDNTWIVKPLIEFRNLENPVFAPIVNDRGEWLGAERISSIEYVGERQTQCISIVHPNDLYITDNFIVIPDTKAELQS